MSEAQRSAERIIEMNLDIERVLVEHGDDVYEDGRRKLSRTLAGPRLDQGWRAVRSEL